MCPGILCRSQSGDTPAPNKQYNPLRCRPRNAVDKDLHPWNGAAPASWDHHVDTPICPVSAGGAGDSIEAVSLRNGQSCYYFSHGCTIHCDRCDGKTARFGSTCGNEKTAKATICDPKHRTLNRNATCGSAEDHYYYSPWRAPGSAPVFDACGMAGGSPSTGPRLAVDG